MAADIVKLARLFETLRTDRNAVEKAWDDIETFIMPLTGKTVVVTSESTQEQQTDAAVWDLTGALACEHLAAALYGNVTNNNARWNDFEWQDAELEKKIDARQYREALAQLLWSEIQTSDFGMEAASGYHEYVGLGGMFLSAEATAGEKLTWQGFDFTAIPCRQSYGVEDSRGGLLDYFRHLRWTPLAIVDKFGEDGVGQRIRDLAADPVKCIEKIDVVYAIFRRPEIKLELEAGPGSPVPMEARPFGFVYFTLDQQEQLGEEGGYYEMPVVYARWGKLPGQFWGFGRGHLALRNVKFINRMKELARAAGASAVCPPTVESEGAQLSKLNLAPGGRNVVRSPDDLKFLDSHARFDVSAEILQDERIEIRRCFHEDDLQLKESPQMTAEEVRERRDRMDRMLGAPVGRLETDGLVPIVHIMLRMLYRAGRLPPAPESVKKAGAWPRVKFINPIARAQLLNEVVGIERSASFVAGLIKMGIEEARYKFNTFQAIEEHSKRVGAPASTLISDDDAKAAMRRDQEMAAQAARASALKDASQGVKNLASVEAPAAVPGGGGPIAGEAFPVAAQPGLVPAGVQLP